MPQTEPFEKHTERYDRWFDAHETAYESELSALQRLVSNDTQSLEIGVGTGRFAEPLGVRYGLDPSESMLNHATERGIEGVQGVAEALPFADGVFDTALLVTTICFVDDIERTFREAHRVLRPEGRLVVGYIDRESPVGHQYQEHKDENPFYKDATFVSTDELVAELDVTGFDEYEFVQTIFQPPDELAAVDDVESGYGDGSFVGIAARR
jgi:ubiquinone/menaquinone biosynthesis C-methylase UbiE